MRVCAQGRTKNAASLHTEHARTRLCAAAQGSRFSPPVAGAINDAHLEHGDAIARLVGEGFELLLGRLDHILRLARAKRPQASSERKLKALRSCQAVELTARLTLSLAMVRANTSAS